MLIWAENVKWSDKPEPEKPGRPAPGPDVPPPDAKREPEPCRCDANYLRED